MDDEEEPLYVTYKLPYFETWDYVDAYYQQECDLYIWANIGYDYRDYYFNPPADPEAPLPTYLLVYAEYNRPFYIYVEENNGAEHLYEVKGYQYNSCKTATAGSYYCVDCQQTLSVTFPAEHVLSDVVLRSNPTCTEGAVVSRYCARCNAVQTYTGEPLGHDYEEGRTVPATCFTEGYTENVCWRCQKVQMTNIKPATGKHVDKNGDNHCDVCGTMINKPAEEPTTKPAEKPAEEKAPKQNFFQRVIEWFKNLFSKLFK